VIELFDGRVRLSIKEQSIGDGLGVRIWAGAFPVIKELAE